MRIFQSFVAFAPILYASSAFANEVCGLQDMISDGIFLDGFSPPTSSGLGPPRTTVLPPQTGISPTVTITYPASGAVIDPGVQVRGIYTGPIATGISVNGQPAYASNGTFVSKPIIVDGGATSLTAKVTTLDGLTSTTSVPITVSATPRELNFSSNASAGFTPLPIKFSGAVKGGLSVQSVSVDFQTDGTPDFTGSSLASIPLYTYTQPGTHTATVTVTLADNRQLVGKLSVAAFDFPSTRNEVCSVYAHLRTRLAAQDAAGAGHALTGKLKSRLLPAFVATGSRMPDVAGRLGTLADGTIGVDVADLLLVREVGNGVRGYPFHMAKDADGVWRIDGM